MTLAISVNIVELACSAGLPLVFTQILAINNLYTFDYIVNIFIYIFFFLIDDLIVFMKQYNLFFFDKTCYNEFVERRYIHGNKTD